MYVYDKRQFLIIANVMKVQRNKKVCKKNFHSQTSPTYLLTYPNPLINSNVNSYFEIMTSVLSRNYYSQVLFILTTDLLTCKLCND